MGIKLVDKLPKCDFCQQPAFWDAPIISRTAWANMCVSCFSVHARHDAGTVGTMFKLRVKEPEKKSVELLVGIEVTSVEELMMDGDRYVECPACGEQRHVEPDAGYTFTCEGCESKVQCGEIM